MFRFMTAVERVEFRPDPNNPNQTIAVKDAWIDSGLYGLRTAVKNFGVDRFKKNCLRASEGFNHVLQRLSDQQHYLQELRLKKWHEVKHKTESLRDTARERAIHAAEVAKAHSTVQAKESKDSASK